MRRMRMNPGAPPTSPAMMVCLLLYALLRGSVFEPEDRPGPAERNLAFARPRLPVEDSPTTRPRATLRIRAAHHADHTRAGNNAAMRKRVWMGVSDHLGL